MVSHGFQVVQDFVHPQYSGENMASCGTQVVAHFADVKLERAGAEGPFARELGSFREEAKGKLNIRHF